MTRQDSTIGDLPVDERAALERTLLLQRKTRPLSKSIPPGQQDGLLPLSYAQQRLWFIHALDPSSVAYNVISALRVRGPLDVTALRRALQDVAVRHQTLRAIFPTIGRTPYVSVDDNAFPDLAVIHASATTADGREAEAMKILEDVANTPFDLTSGPIFRPLLIAIEPTDHVFLLVIHHIACDEWSMRNLHREIDHAYRARSAGTPLDLPLLPIQYSDFAIWQRKQLATRAYDSAQSYWRTRLAGAPTAFTLPYDKLPSTHRHSLGRRHRWLIPSDLARRVDRLGREAGTTPFVTMLAAFMALLHGRVGADDAVIGTPTAGRGRSELEHLVGYFSNMLVLRTDASGNPSFGDFLTQVRARVLEGLAHQDLPFDKIVEAVNPRRAKDGAPMFKIMFTHRNAFEAPLNGPLLQASKIEMDREHAKCDLWLSSIDHEDGRWATIVYDTDLFHSSTIESLARDFQRALETIVFNPDRPLEELWDSLSLTAGSTSTAVSTLAGAADGFRESSAPPDIEPALYSESATRMLEIWRRVLGQQGITFNDNFFDLGGHSMLALQLFAEIDDQFGVSLPLALLYETPTVSALANQIDELRGHAQKSISDKFVYPVAGGNGPPLFFCGIDLVLARPSLWTAPCPLYAVANWAMGSGFVKSRSLKTLAATHVASIRQIQPKGPYLLGGYCHGALIALEIAHQLRAAGEEIKLLFLLDPMVGAQASTPVAETTSGVIAALPAMIQPLRNRVVRKIRMIAEGPRAHGWKTWLLFFIPFSFDPIVNWTKYFLVGRYLRSPNATPKRLRYQAIWGSFWFTAERMFRGYAAHPYDGATLIVFSNSCGRSEFWEKLIGTEGEARYLDFHHYALFQKPAVTEWMGWLSAAIRARR